MAAMLIFYSDEDPCNPYIKTLIGSCTLNAKP